MTDSSLPGIFTPGRIVSSARILTAVWALFWVGVGLLFAVGEGFSQGVVGMLMAGWHAVPGLLFALLVFIAWRWEAPGAVLLLLVSLGIPIFFRGLKPPIILAMTAPPLLGGVLFLVHWRLTRQPA